ncbi:MAG: HAMP domain-containing histidine kinase [Opitutaceae bacterium]|nr:HAMP domain-containing histidine kinase [Opitutaceae bacterium]
MSSKPERLRIFRSLSARLTVFYTALFLLSLSAVFVAVYMLIARTIREREREVLEVRAAEYANVLQQGGIEVLRLYIERDQEPFVRSLFVRVIGERGQVNLAFTPPAWRVEGPVTMERDNWGELRPKQTVTIQIPADARRDLTEVRHPLPNGLLLVVARTTDNRAVFLEPLKRTMWIAGAITVVVVSVGGAFVSWRAIRPVRQVAATAREIIATGDLSRNVPDTRRNDEVGELVEQFNTLLTRNHNLLRAMKDALDNVAHDVRTPLTRLRAGAEAALGAGDDPAAVREALADCVEETDRIRSLLDTLLDVSAAEAGVLALKRESVDVRGLVEGVVELYALVAEEKNIQLMLQAGQPATIEADATRLRQVVANLVDNAVKYTPEGGSVYVGWDRRVDRVVIAVRDTGPGVPPGEQDKIWRRLYRGDQSRSQRGLGLGLSVVKAIVEAHGGHVAVMNHSAGGAVFTVELPFVSTPPLQIAG